MSIPLITIDANPTNTKILTIEFEVPDDGSTDSNPQFKGGQQVFIRGKRGYVAAIEYVDMLHASKFNLTPGWHYQVNFYPPHTNDSLQHFTEQELLRFSLPELAMVG